MNANAKGYPQNNQPAVASNASSQTAGQVLTSNGAGVDPSYQATGVPTGVIKADGSVPFTGDQSLGSHKLTNVTDPASAQDAATKNYVDSHPISITSTHGSVFQILAIEEEITLANAATTDSTTNLLPANAIIYGITSRITGALLNARTFSLGDSSNGARYAQAGQSGTLATLTNTNSAGTTSPGGPAAGPLAPFANPLGTGGSKIRVTLSNADGGDGAATKIRVCVFYSTLGNLTS